MKNYKGIEYLRNKLNIVKSRVETRYSYYDMKKKEHSLSITIPQEIRQKYSATLGWCAKSVDTLADRLYFKKFENDIFEVNEIFKLNNPDVFFDNAILSALISSCCFVYISQGEEDIPRLQVIEGDCATGIIDPITNLLTEGYAILNKNDEGRPILEAYFISGRTDYYINGEYSYSYKNQSPYALLVPIIHRPDAKRPFGRSRISRSCMYYQKLACRTLERADVTAEFYSFPQKYIVGLSEDVDLDGWKATISSMLQISAGDTGEQPKLGQFTTPSMSPFTEQLRTAAAGFAGETGLTLDDLGFVSDNPSSSEAIKASHETLRLFAKKAQRTFGSGFLNVGYLASCVRDNFAYRRDEFYNLIPKWQPVFEPDAATLSSIGDGAIKINQAIPNYFDKKTLSDLTGIEGSNDE
ncbi:phage portal protein [Parvimonas micra]|uniref:phage portal protein n=1 Tax=Parvimonas micra TaxID=33033 RepID=UPI000E46DDD0|nr:phage portal protein [Parvimonas micra]AXU11160.1 phage portal protein [Parvimonas micra]